MTGPNCFQVKYTKIFEMFQYSSDDQTDKKIHFSPKLERPRSLSIQQSEEHLEENQSKDENTKDADKTEENEAPKK
ncbi:hypothetical protein NQ317_009174 [Molorchus minor]|uniref:Uncharacterized protein n=1 Tax=Molorchus minor TaxID=1323400 RepID=A0ABQ9J4P4_9CUCU|nr:hypothetical protein NQ317_009174 [Molorchus minor]